MTKPLFSEWFSTKYEAQTAAKRLKAKGYVVKVERTMRINGRKEWLLEAW